MTARLTAAALAFVALGASAQDERAARSLAATCASCHGTEGRSVTAELATLAGLPKDDILTKLRGFRGGARPSTVMQQIAKGYSDAQLELIADYFARRRR
jgi:cytochrome subunit of sulfide dehydrogenase